LQFYFFSSFQGDRYFWTTSTSANVPFFRVTLQKHSWITFHIFAADVLVTWYQCWQYGCRPAGLFTLVGVVGVRYIFLFIDIGYVTYCTVFACVRICNSTLFYTTLFLFSCRCEFGMRVYYFFYVWCDVEVTSEFYYSISVSGVDTIVIPASLPISRSGCIRSQWNPLNCFWTKYWIWRSN
jgi:hypothetical protein